MRFKMEMTLVKPVPESLPKLKPEKREFADDDRDRVIALSASFSDFLQILDPALQINYKLYETVEVDLTEAELQRLQL